MIYTIGYAVNYDRYLAEHEALGQPLEKLGRTDSCDDPEYPNGYPGGICFQSIDDANRYLAEQELVGYSVYGLVAEWGVDTYNAPETPYWQSLIRNATIVRLPTSDATLKGW